MVHVISCVLHTVNTVNCVQLECVQTNCIIIILISVQANCIIILLLLILLLYN